MNKFLIGVILGLVGMKLINKKKLKPLVKPLVNPKTGEIDFKYNPISIDENFYV